MLRISYTQTSYIRSCPRKYKFRYVDHLIPKVKDRFLLRGTVVHESFEKYFNGISLDDILKQILDIYDKELNKASVDNYEDMLIDKYVVYGMFKHYPFNDLDFEEVIPEKEFDVKIDGLRGVRLVGRVDGLVKKDGKWWIRELKTTGSPFYQVENRSRVSYQASGYIYGVQKALKIKINGILFDFIRTSMLRKKTTDTAQTFGERILDDYKNHMNDSRTGMPLRQSRMYKRYYSYRSPHQIAEYETDIVKAANQIRKCRKNKDFMRNPDVCYFYGKECPYLKICWLENEPSENLIKAYYSIEDDQTIKEREGTNGKK